MQRLAIHHHKIQISQCRQISLLLLVSTCIIVTWLSALPAQAANTGKWATLLTPGISAMHMATTRFNKVIVFDRTDFGPSQMRLPNGRCRDNPNDLALKRDCYAHSYEYDVSSNRARPLMVLTDTWCSSGAFVANGTLLQTGGFNDGATAIRYFQPCVGATCDWLETGHLSAARWYASNQILPDNRVIVVGGQRAFSYEFLPKKTSAETAIPLGFLTKTHTPNIENNLYPFIHLSSDGNLFIFGNKQSILLNYKTNRVVKTFPDLPSGPRNYPSSGSSVMLPLRHTDGFKIVEVMICGGSPDEAFNSAGMGVYMDALNDCGRMVITDAKPKWVMEKMPAPRVMGDMLLLPTGDVLIINGAEQGTAGWGAAKKPARAPFLYSLGRPAGRRFVVFAASDIPRMYHSTANVLADGRVLVGGSNTNVGYVFEGVEFPTELRLEAFSPYYRHAGYSAWRPSIRRMSTTEVKYGGRFVVKFTVATPPAPAELLFNMYAPPFTTHSYSMNQRMLFLAFSFSTAQLRNASSATSYEAVVSAPPSSVAAPSGFYMLRVVNRGVPSSATWIRIS
ncbi:hypothetical protein GOP47_0026071 [Adiantum capillus-veneris]|uniref:Galactose oxidase n=1 Tax=Adiantum capillus-veneris TaxID=13818 RepID=A0A9D4Z454_ADICA|nr:hypothetical protein GOP47_0026071 [Adiantum capillus-veneris]